MSVNRRPIPQPAPLSEQTLEMLTLTVLYAYGGQAPWATVRQATQALVNELFPAELHYLLGPALTHTRDRLQAKGQIVYSGPGAQVTLR